MLFNSIDFAIFLPVVFIIYWLLKRNVRAQNFLLLISSYIFYGWWDWRFLSLIVISSFIDFFVGHNLSKTEKQSKRKILLLISILINLGFLGFFKYFNFFAESFAQAFTLFGKEFSSARLNIVLPVGISFYTFQTLSYSIDIYKRKFEPTKDIISFFAFVSFFPQLVAGPIERARNLLPQFYSKRTFDFDKASDGLRQIIWGLLKKIVIADNCAVYVNDIFANYHDHTGSTLLLGAIFFAFQIYGDFSGYSDIAIGTARLFGFDLMRNFAFPYFSRDIAEFWRRWHISLSSWFRDYLYIPLGGSRGGVWMKIRNTFIIFIVSGFWHGANWTFIIWGFLNALYFLPLMLLKRNRINTDTVAQNTLFPSFREFIQMGFTFFITLIAWVFFRAETISDAVSYIANIFHSGLFTVPDYLDSDSTTTLLFLLLVLTMEWFGRFKSHALEFSFKRRASLKSTLISSFIILLIILGSSSGKYQFIYFQF